METVELIINIFIVEEKYGRRYKGKTDNRKALSTIPVSIRR